MSPITKLLILATIVSPLLAEDLVLDATKGVRRTYEFTRAFVFGPAGAPSNSRPRLPGNLALVAPDLVWSEERGFGFEATVADAAATYMERGYFGKPYSPLARSFIASRKGAKFTFRVPDGEYVLHAISGAPYPSFPRPSDTHLRSGGAVLHLENPLTEKMLMRGDLAVEARQGRVTVEIDTRTSWVLAALLVYPVGDAARATRAIDDFRREFYRFPLEEHYRNRRWLKIPTEGNQPLPEKEEQEGYSLYAVPAASPVLRWHVPQYEDRRGGPLRALAGRGETVNVSFALHAVRPMDGVTCEVVSPHPTIDARLWVARQSEVRVGRRDLNQWAEVPKTLWPARTLYLDAGTNQQLYVSLRPGPQTPVGVHEGKALVRWKGEVLGSFPVRLGVLPFTAPEDPHFSDGAYYNPFLFGYQNSRIPWEQLTDEERALALRTERVTLRDLRAHGLNTMHLMGPRGLCRELPDGSVKFEAGPVLPLFMELLMEAGLGGRPIVLSLQLDYDAGGAVLKAEAARAGVKVKTRPDRRGLEGKLSRQFLEGITSVISQIEVEREKRGWPELIYDLWDEPGLQCMKPAIQMYQAVRAGGGRTYLTVVPQMAPHIADVLDVRVYSGGPGAHGGQAETPRQVIELKKKLGTQWWDYSGGCTSPDRVARFQVGTYWWAWNFDGLCPWKIIKWIGDWRNDYDGWDVHPVIPTPSGMLTSTIGWEMAREGKQDRNLLRALEARSRTVSSSAARDATAYISKLREAMAFPRSGMLWSDPASGAPVESNRAWPAERFDRNRALLVQHMLKLSGPGLQAGPLHSEAQAIMSEAGLREFWRIQRRTASLPPPREGNLVKNGGFEMEAGKDGAVPHWPRWSRNGRVVTEGARAGQRCFLFHHDKVQPNDCVRTEPIPVSPGRTYRLSAWLKRQAPEGTTSQFTGLWPHTYGDGADKFVRRLPVWIPKADRAFDWRRYELTFRATARETSVVIWLYTGDAAGDIWMDDVTLTEVRE